MQIPSLDKIWQLIHDKLYNWMELGAQHVPNMVVALLVAVVFAFLARFIASGTQQILKRSVDSLQIASLLAAIVRTLILGIGLFIALDFLGLKGTVTSLLAGAGIVGLAIGFAFQDMTENLIAGVAMGIRKPFRPGDVIEADGVFGTVDTINLRNTLLTSFYGQRLIVPNKMLFQNKLTNFSALGVRRIEVPVGISYADDPDKAREVLVEALNQCDFVIRQDETQVYCEGFGASSIDLLVWCWISYPGETGFMEARHQIVSVIKRTLADNDILIPFPIRTLDFGIRGGVALQEQLSATARKEGSAANDHGD